ncbi:hypothetical protein MLD38_006235 [Melastoma candidum]|uniref:Uncharacterized protein n=1 Tax=Melastoma candidum TaxID=119954 RepID=A0ACB9RQ99_9MYRT|nr:hypothetical protein MLD38_006235 [Melastoma candidum]
MGTIPLPLLSLLPSRSILFFFFFCFYTLCSVLPSLASGEGVRLSSSVDLEALGFHGDYSPPSPPPPVLPPRPPSLTCDDLGGVGSLDTSCRVNSSLSFAEDVYVEGLGSLNLLPGVNVSCPRRGCFILVNISGDFSLGENAMVSTGTLHVVARNGRLGSGSVVNVVGLAGEPPSQTSGTPQGIQGAGGGHGGRGANCVAENGKLPDDVWGGDAYSWSSLDEPFSYGSKGGTTSKEEDFGGGGGGRIKFEIDNELEVSGSLIADGDVGGAKGGGGSGGSIYIVAHRMTGNGIMSASGGSGFGGGGGGRISVNVFSRHDDTEYFVHGGRSLGCPDNAGAAGTYYDAVPRSLTVDNHNRTTVTDTLLLEFPKQPLWTNVYIQNHAKACVPLYWGRVQVRGQLRMTTGAILSFGLAHFASSEFELLAEELLMSDSVIKIYGALRMAVKMHLMWNSKMLINGGHDTILATSLLEASNLLVLRESSVIHSNANLGVHGQGFLNLSGPGDLIEAQRLVISLFFSISVGPGSMLRGPLESADDGDLTPRLYCDLEDCPRELLHPPEDCNVNSSLPFTLQVCRVEDIIVEGIVTGSVVHFHWVRTVAVHSTGTVTASGLGCTGGVGRGSVLENGPGSGGGHGGKGGDGYYNGSLVVGGSTYGNPQLPCELGSGSGNGSADGVTTGGGIIVMGSFEHSLTSLSIDGSIQADGRSFGENTRRHTRSTWNVGPGGGSGGTILVFLRALSLSNYSVVSATGGHGSPNGGGGGGGGRIHFHWYSIPIGDEYSPLAKVNGSILSSGGFGRGEGRPGGNGTVTGKACPKGLYGIFCEECPLGTYKNVSGSDRALCQSCPINELPRRARYITVRGGVTETPCPYKCISERFHLPNCYTAFEELVYTFGGPWLFGFILLAVLVLLAVVLSVARMKYVGGDELPSLVPARRSSRIDHSFPFLESLNEVLETNRIEESQSHVHRMHFMGPNTFSEPWHLPHSPPEQICDIVFEDAFNRFVDEINHLAAYQWWEGSVYLILSLVAYPLAWSWLQRCRKRKLQQLREFVRSEYDHACLRSCRSRALYEGLKVAATSDLMLGYVDFFLGGDEKRPDLPPRLHQRFPMSLMFGGDGSYMAPFCLHNDNILTSLMSQAVPPTIWYRLVAGLNAQLRLVCRGQLRITMGRVVSWLQTHANPTLSAYGVHLDLACFQPTASGYCQFGIIASGNQTHQSLGSGGDGSPPTDRHPARLGGSFRENVGNDSEGKEDLPLLILKKIHGNILDAKTLRTVKEKKSISQLSSLVVYNTKPMGHQDLVGLVISMLLLGDFSLVLLTLLQFYSISLLDFLLVLFILPLAILYPFPAGISALFSHGPRRSAGLARVYALWNITSLTNVVVAFVCGFLHYKAHSSKKHQSSYFQSWNFSMDESEWWMLPSGLVMCKIVQARLIDWHVANQEIQDHSLYSNDPDVFWQS